VSGGWFTSGDPEPAWQGGRLHTEKEMIDMIAGAGFDVLRIPITWSTGEGVYRRVGDAPDYVIRQDFFERIEEVVNWGLDNGMFVIINTHHDRWIYLTDDNFDNESDKLVKLWRQIAEYFKNYGDRLIFETMNEPLGRNEHGHYDWYGRAEFYGNINKLNQLCVDVIRSTGGNNEKRFLMLPTYAASSGSSPMQAFELPEDMHPNKLIASIHTYTPFNFALNTDMAHNQWGSSGDRRELDRLFMSIDRIFASNGIPVILGEFGAMNKDNEEIRAEWAEYYVAGAREYGMPCVWWDNNIFEGDGERFGLFDRENLEFPFPLLLQGLMNGAGN
jgi:endoglucanase